jgi:hypothetical protein
MQISISCVDISQNLCIIIYVCCIGRPILNSSISISSHPTEKTFDTPLFLLPHLLPHRKKFTLNYFFGLSSYPTENKLVLKYSFGPHSYPTNNIVDAQLFFRPQRVRHREHDNPVTMATELRFSDSKDFRNRNMIWNAY